MENNALLFGSIGLGCLAIAVIIAIIRPLFKILLRPLGCLAALFAPLPIVVGFACEPIDKSKVVAGCGLLLFAILAFRLKRKQERESTNIIIEGVARPKRKSRRPLFAKPPKITPEFLERLCIERLKKSETDIELLRSCINRAVVVRGISDWSRAEGDTYFDEATQRQLDFLLSLDWTGAKPRYLGEASCYIEVALILKDYRERHENMRETRVNELVADFISVWNAATSSGTLFKNDAKVLLQLVSAAPKSKERDKLARAIKSFVESTTVSAECPPELFTLASAWIAPGAN